MDIHKVHYMPTFISRCDSSFKSTNFNKFNPKIGEYVLFLQNRDYVLYIRFLSILYRVLDHIF